MDKNLDKTERILVDILKEVKHLFEIAKCNKSSKAYLDSYYVVKNKLQKYNPKLKVKNLKKIIN